MGKSNGGGGRSGGKSDYNSIHKSRIRRYAEGHGVGFIAKKTKEGSGTKFILTAHGRRYSTTSASVAIDMIEKLGTKRR